MRFSMYLKPTLFILATSLLATSGAFAETTPAPAATPAAPATTAATPTDTTPAQTKESMTALLKELSILRQYFTSETEFTDPKNATEIGNHLKLFSEAAKKTAHDPLLNQENFKFSRQVLEEHIADTERVFRLGNKTYARWMMNSTVTVCMSCHTQLPSQSTSLAEFTNSKTHYSDFDQAEFLFATRDFNKASEMYDKMILSYKPSSAQGSLKVAQLETAVERQVAYYSRITRDPKAAIKKLQAYKKNSHLPKFLQQHLTTWAGQFKAWTTSETPDPKKATDAQIIDFVQKTLGENATVGSAEVNSPQLVNYLRVSGVIYEYLQAHPKSKSVPQFLFWLALCDRSTNNNFFFSLADIYLRECIIHYSKDPMAKKCLAEYQTEVTMSYSGSSGTHIPADVQEDLQKLTTLVNGEEKVKLSEP